MALPKVTIEVLNGALGQVASTDDGVAGLLMTGVAAAGIPLSEAKQIFSVADAEALGLTASYDTTNTTNVYKSIKDFYAQAGTGKELWIMIVAKTTTMATSCDTANDILKKLLNAAQGRIRICGVTRVADVAYAPVYADQLDPDVIAAAAKAHALANEFALAFKPVRIVLDGRDFQGNTGTLLNLKLSSYNRIGVALFTDVSGSDNAAVGLVLGRLAANPVQRNIGRVKDGDLGIANAYLTGQTTLIENLPSASQDAVHDKGFMFVRKYAAKNGYFFNDDPTATAATDDFNSIARGRVIDKAIVITNQVYTNELLDDLDVDENGRIDAGVIKMYQSNIKRQIDGQMTAEDEISAARVVINPAQNVLSTNRVDVELFITPKFYPKEIKVKLGFENPTNA